MNSLAPGIYTDDQERLAHDLSSDISQTSTNPAGELADLVTVAPNEQGPRLSCD